MLFHSGYPINTCCKKGKINMDNLLGNSFSINIEFFVSRDSLCHAILLPAPSISLGMWKFLPNMKKFSLEIWRP